MARFDRFRTLGLVLLGWGLLGGLAVAAIFAIFCAPWFEGETWELPNLNSPLAIFTAIGLAGAALNVAAGAALLGSSRFARPLALAACAISLLNFPIGTALGTYGFIVLLGKDDGVGSPGEPG